MVTELFFFAQLLFNRKDFYRKGAIPIAIGNAKFAKLYLDKALRTFLFYKNLFKKNLCKLCVTSAPFALQHTIQIKLNNSAT